MANLEEYNKINHSGPNHYARRTITTSWVLGHTSNHHTGVAVFWNEIENKLACFSQVWPHDGWQEYDELDFCREHSPWSAPSDEWLFIGEI